MKLCFNSMDIKQFASKLKSARLEKGLSQRGLGLALGLSDKTISSYESNRSYPSLEILFKISEVLDKSVEYFISSSSVTIVSDSLKRIESTQKSITEEIDKIKRVINTGE